jgi:hypothetical protein
MQVFYKLSVAVKGMARTIKYPVVWKPSLYMFLSLALSISTHEGQFYWYTNKEPPNPGFSQVKVFFMTFLILLLTIRFITQSKGSLVLYHNVLAHQMAILYMSQMTIECFRQVFSRYR